MFTIDHNHNIRITAGDTAELSTRLFNKSTYLPKHLWGHKTVKTVHDYISVPPIIDSEGNIHYLPPICNCHDEVVSDGIPHYHAAALPWPAYPREEEYILGRLVLTVKNPRSGDIVLKKENDEFPNSIFLDEEDTEDLDPELYLYQLCWYTQDPFGDSEDGTREVCTTMEGYFEVLEKF